MSRKPDVKEMIRCPRGLVALSALCGEDPDLWARWTAGPLADPYAHPFHVRTPAITGRGGDMKRLSADVLDDPERLAVHVLRAIGGYAWWGSRRLAGGIIDRFGRAFEVAAQELLDASGSRWWGEDVDRDQQIIVGLSDLVPDLAALADEQDWTATHLPWRVPQSLTTSRRLGDLLPAVMLCDREAISRWPEPVGCWAVRVDPDARVYEVHRLDDWRDLCARYPGAGPTPSDYRAWGVDAPTAVAPDWPAVAQEWDGLHVSMLGLLTATGVPTRVGDAAAVLEDVGSEFTTWWRPRFDTPRLTATRTGNDLP